MPLLARSWRYACSFSGNLATPAPTPNVLSRRREPQSTPPTGAPTLKAQELGQQVRWLDDALYSLDGLRIRDPSVQTTSLLSLLQLAARPATLAVMKQHGLLPLILDTAGLWRFPPGRTHHSQRRALVCAQSCWQSLLSPPPWASRAPQTPPTLQTRGSSPPPPL